MITKLYIDNFRCFTNFKLALGNVQLFLGPNGGGKTSVFDVLQRIRSLMRGHKVADLFSRADLTARDRRPMQTFHVELEEGDDHFRYELQVGLSKEPGSFRISQEQLTWNGNTCYRFDDGQVHLHGLKGHVAEDMSFPCDSTQSFMSLMTERGEEEPVTRFRNAVDRWVFLSIAPMLMDTFSKEESRFIYRNASNFSSLYRCLSEMDMESIVTLTESLREAIPQLAQLQHAPVGEAMALKVKFDGLDAPLLLDQLSDGQRVLIVLYTMLAAMRSLRFDLYIDEPDNYVALREIQPWLHALQDTAVECDRQVIIISHHPEIVNDMADSDGKWFHRSENGRVQVGEYPIVPGLTHSETMARGWEGE